MNIQCCVQRGFEVGRNCFRVTVKTCFRHALCDALADVRASIGCIQPI